jgi:hypothetical protein
VVGTTDSPAADRSVSQFLTDSRAIRLGLFCSPLALHRMWMRLIRVPLKPNADSFFFLSSKKPVQIVSHFPARIDQSRCEYAFDILIVEKTGRKMRILRTRMSLTKNEFNSLGTNLTHRVFYLKKSNGLRYDQYGQSQPCPNSLPFSHLYHSIEYNKPSRI